MILTIFPVHIRTILNRLLARSKVATVVIIPALFLAAATPTQAQVRAPDASNSLKIKPNPTATVTAVCHKLGEGE